MAANPYFLPSNLPMGTFTAKQEEILNQYYQLCRHPGPTEREYLAQILGEVEPKIQAWFHNKREIEIRQRPPTIIPVSGVTPNNSQTPNSSSFRPVPRPAASRTFDPRTTRMREWISHGPMASWANFAARSSISTILGSNPTRRSRPMPQPYNPVECQRFFNVPQPLPMAPAPRENSVIRQHYSRFQPEMMEGIEGDSSLMPHSNYCAEHQRLFNATQRVPVPPTHWEGAGVSSNNVQTHPIDLSNRSAVELVGPDQRKMKALEEEFRMSILPLQVPEDRNVRKSMFRQWLSKQQAKYRL